MAYFCRLKTLQVDNYGKPIVMGRKTWQSLARPLPGRDNVILSRNKEFEASGCSVFTSLDDVLQFYATKQEVMIIGGSAVYKLALPLTQKLYVTQIIENMMAIPFSLT